MACLVIRDVGKRLACLGFPLLVIAVQLRDGDRVDAPASTR